MVHKSLAITGQIVESELPDENKSVASSSSQVQISSEPPTFDNLIKFIESQISISELLEENLVPLNISNKQGKFNYSKNNNVSTTPAARVLHSQTNQPKVKGENKCLICKGDHFFLYCNDFKSKSIDQRKEFIKVSKLCYNCFDRHFINDCHSDRRCPFCNGKHHASLHIKSEDRNSVVTPKIINFIYSDNQHNEINSESVDDQKDSHEINSYICKIPNEISLSTAMIKVCDLIGYEMYICSLVDQCSQGSFITETLFQKLQLNFTVVKMGENKFYSSSNFRRGRYGYLHL